MREGFEREVEERAHELVAKGEAASIELARAQAWREDLGRLDAHHWPGAERCDSHPIAADKKRRAADRAAAKLAEILGAGDVVVGHRLTQEKSPQLCAAARGMPRLVR